MLKKKSNKKGFTIMEMLIVVAIIAVLAAIAIPTMTSALTKSKEAADVANIRAAYAETQVAILTDEVTKANYKTTFETALGTPATTLNYVASDSDTHGYSYTVGTGNATTDTITYTASKLERKDGSNTYTWVIGEK